MNSTPSIAKSAKKAKAAKVVSDMDGSASEHLAVRLNGGEALVAVTPVV